MFAFLRALVRRVLVGSALVCSLLAFSTRTGAAQHQVGINTAALKDYTGDVVFVDVFKQAREWISQYTHNNDWANPAPLDLGENGWPASLESGQAAGTLLFNSLGGRYPGGRYVVLYDGTGQFEFRFDARAVSFEPGRIELDVTPSDLGMHVKIEATDPDDPVRNVRIVMEEYEATFASKPFYPPFLDFLQPFSIIRMMDWQEANSSDVSEWADRTTPDSYTQTLPSGVALEYQIDLANTLGADPWFTIPHLATDDFVRRYARMIAERLDPSLTAYVEYSNEVWNFSFEQADYALAQGADRGLSDSDPYQAMRRFYSERSVEVFDIFEEEFGGLDRLQRVFAWQNPHTYGSNEILEWKDAYLQADVLATAPYFDGPPTSTQAQQEAVEAMSVDEILDWAEADIDTTLDLAAAQKLLADQFGLRFLTYEGGQHLAGPRDHDAITELYVAANREERMGDLYAKYLEDWASFSDEPVVLYNAIKKFGPSGSWGLMEYLLQDPTTAPKYLAVLGHMGTGVAAEEGVLPDRDLGLSIYPNPARGSGVVKLTVGEAAAVEFEVYDVLGRRLGVRPVHVYGAGEHRMDLGSVVPAALPAGVYFVRARTVGGSAALSATAALTVVLTVVR